MQVTTSEATENAFPDDPHAAVRSAATALFATLAITRVIVVDDYYSHDVGLAEVTDAISDGSIDLTTFATEHETELDLLIDENTPRPITDIMDEIRLRWDDLDETTRRELTALVLSRDGATTVEARDGQTVAVVRADDEAAILNFQQYFPEHTKYVQLGARQWIAERDTLLSQDSAGTLVFFDQDLSRENLSMTGGRDLIADLIGRGLTGIRCGLLTHQVKTVDSELALAAELSAALDGSSVAVLGKNRTTDPEDFLTGLRVYLLVTEISNQQQHLAFSLQAAADAAQQAIKALDPYSFVTAVESARHEGGFELDGPLRILNGVLRRSLTSRLRDNLDHASIARLRAGSDLKLNGKMLTQPASHRELTWDDAFDEGMFINQLHLPLEVGDIFEVDNDDADSALFVLLVQPCDLTVRSRGTRGTRTDSFALARLRKHPEGSGGESRPPIISPHRGDDDAWEVNLADIIYVPTNVLDSTVFNSDGRAVLSPHTDPASHLLESWSKRGADLERWRKKRLTESKKVSVQIHSKTNPQVRQHLQTVIDSTLIGLVGTRIKGTIDHPSETVSCNLRRTSRLLEPAANQLLTFAGQRQYRPALNAALFRELPTS